MKRIILISILLVFTYTMIVSANQIQMVNADNAKNTPTQKVLEGLIESDLPSEVQTAGKDGGSQIRTGNGLDEIDGTPDLEITSIANVPLNPQPGSTVEILITITNTGTAESGSFYLDVFTNQPMKPEHGDQGDFTVLVSGLFPEAHVTESVNVIYTEHGTKHLWALVDSQNEIIEILNDNNVFGTYEIPVGTATMISVESPEEIEVPAGGSEIFYEVTVQQFGDESTIDGWVSITNTSYGTGIDILGFPVRTFYSGLPYAFQFQQIVPSFAAAGTYQLAVAMGVYPWIVETSDKLYFTKSGTQDDMQTDMGGPNDWPVEIRVIQAGGSGEQITELPSTIELSPAYPNPFNPTTTITMSLPEASELVVSVFNLQGCEVVRLARGTYPAGEHQLTFDGHGLASGAYLVQARTNLGNSAIQKVMLMK